MLNTVNIIQSGLNPSLEIEGILLTMYDGRLRLSKQVVAEVRRHLQGFVFDTIIHRNVRISEAPQFGQSVLMHDLKCKGAVNYLKLAKELVKKNDMLEEA